MSNSGAPKYSLNEFYNCGRMCDQYAEKIEPEIIKRIEHIKKKKEDTTDVHLYNMTVKNKILISQFLVCLAEASIDCSMHEPNFDASVRDEIHCKLCAVTNTKLYHPLIAKDMMLPDPCKKLTTEEISAKEIDVDGEKYYYTDDFNIFKFNKDVNGYILLQSHEPHHADIMKKLLMD